LREEGLRGSREVSTILAPYSSDTTALVGKTTCHPSEVDKAFVEIGLKNDPHLVVLLVQANEGWETLLFLIPI